jgi:hypothetical protein
MVTDRDRWRAGLILVAIVAIFALANGDLHLQLPDRDEPTPAAVASAAPYADAGPPATQASLTFRIGAQCTDGTSSTATGSGACSWHGGVLRWMRSDCPQHEVLAYVREGNLGTCRVGWEPAA